MSTRPDIPSPDWLLDREFEKHERLRALLLLARHFDTPHYWKAVGNVWTHNESLFQDLDLLDELWSGAGHHDASMRHLAMSRDDRERFRTLPETLTVWRGCYRKNLAGWSWTLDRDQALFFSTRYVPDGRPLIAEAEVSRQDVLAFFGGGGEAFLSIAGNRNERPDILFDSHGLIAANQNMTFVIEDDEVNNFTFRNGGLTHSETNLLASIRHNGDIEAQGALIANNGLRVKSPHGRPP